MHHSGGRRYAGTIPSTQICYKPKTAQKTVYFKNRMHSLTYSSYNLKLFLNRRLVSSILSICKLILIFSMILINVNNKNNQRPKITIMKISYNR
jgi:hypothetical protein